MALGVKLAAMSGVDFERNKPEPTRATDTSVWVGLQDGTVSPPDMVSVNRWEYQATCLVTGIVGATSQDTVETANDAHYVAVLAVLKAAYADKLGVEGVESIEPGACEFEVGEGIDPTMGFEQQVIIHYATQADDPSLAP